MKISFYPLIALSLLLASCSKSTAHHTSGTGPIGSWQLVKKQQVIGAGSQNIVPPRFSSVELTLNANSTYTSKLNNDVVAQGAYTIIPDTSGYHIGGLELKNFKTTGIFSLFTVYQLGSGGQVVSEYDGMSMKISHDTMTLTSVITPGGWISYDFVRE